MRIVAFILLSAIALTACMGEGASIINYVVIKPDEAAKLIASVTAIANENGMETAVARIVSDTGNVTTVVESRGHGLKLWMQNVLLDGHEDPALCGVFHEAHPDPAQFMVLTQPWLFGSKTAAIKLGDTVISRLRKAGFDVRLKSAICGAAARVSSEPERP